VKGSFIIDASAILKLVVEEPGTREARLFFGYLSDPKPIFFFAPDLLYVECASAVLKYVTRYHYPLEQARIALRALLDLPIQATPTQLLFQDALEMALHLRISAYDACYLALAQQLRCPLVTEDIDLIRKVSLRRIGLTLYPLSEAILHT
jgi:predicted nucleic acid-binding protein